MDSKEIAKLRKTLVKIRKYKRGKVTPEEVRKLPYKELIDLAANDLDQIYKGVPKLVTVHRQIMDLLKLVMTEELRLMILRPKEE